MHSSSVILLLDPFGNSLSLRSLIIFSPSTKQGRSCYPKSIISTKIITLSACSYKAIKPYLINSLNSTNCGDLVPPNTSTYSAVSLKGAVSNLMPFPGELESKKPKSICMI